MKTEARVIDLGSGYGKVVRHFFKETWPAFTMSLHFLCCAYKARAITREEAEHYLKNAGYRLDHVSLLLDIAERR